MLCQWTVLLVCLLSSLHVAVMENVFVCIIEEQNDILLGNETQLYWNSTDLVPLLRKRTSYLGKDIAVARLGISPTKFPYLSTIACDYLNSSCIGVLSLTSCEHAHQVDSWALEHTIPHISLSDDACSVTSLRNDDTTTLWSTGNRVLYDLLTYLRWDKVAMFVDSRIPGWSSTADLVKQLSDAYVGTLSFRLFDHLHRHSTMNQSEAHVHHVNQHLNTVQQSNFFHILLIAKQDAVSIVLREAQKSGLVSRHHFWVIFLLHSSHDAVINEITAKDANVLIVQHYSGGPGDFKECPYVKQRNDKTMGSYNFNTSVLEQSLDDLLAATTQSALLDPDYNHTAKSSVCDNSTEALLTRSVIVRNLNETAKSRLLSSFDQHYTVLSTEQTQEMLRAVKVGAWTRSDGLHVSVEQLYRNTFRDFGYRTLRIGSVETPPFFQRVGNTSLFEGFCVDIIRVLSYKLKFRYEFVQPPDNQWGAPTDDQGNWTGVIQMVLKGEADIGIGPISITSIREEVIDFTKPFMEDGVGILTKRPNSDGKNMFKMFTPLTPVVWSALAGAVVAVSLCLYCIERLSPFSARNLHDNRQLGMLGCVWLVYGSYMEQGGSPHPRSASGRLLLGCLWLFTILMSSTYTANLAAFLTVTIAETPIDSLPELADSSELRPLAKAGSNIKTLFEKSEGGVYQQIWGKMSGMPSVTTTTQALPYVVEDNYAYMTDASQLEFVMLQDCTTYSLAKELFNTGGFGFVLRENSPYMDAINYNIMKMQEAGLMDKWRQQWWSRSDKCSSSDRTSAAKKLDWPSLSGLFYIFLGVMAFSVVLRFLEGWLHRDNMLRLWNRMKSVVRMANSAESAACQCHWGEESVSSEPRCSVCLQGSESTRGSRYRKASLASKGTGISRRKLSSLQRKSRVEQDYKYRLGNHVHTTEHRAGLGAEFQDFEVVSNYRERVLRSAEISRVSARENKKNSTDSDSGFQIEFQI